MHEKKVDMVEMGFESWKSANILHSLLLSSPIPSLSISHLHVVTRSDQTLTRVLSGKISLIVNMCAKKNSAKIPNPVLIVAVIEFYQYTISE